MKIYDYMELLRRIVFYFFIILYLVICPLVILYAFGYIYNPLRKDIEETGLVHIKTRPANASVYLEKSRYRHITPTTIYNLFPGIYKISLFLKSHHPWSENITIEPGKAVDLNMVLLLPQLFKMREIVKRPVSDILLIEGTNNLLVLEKQRLNQIKVLSLDDYQLENLDKGDVSIEHIYTAEDSNRILVRTKKAGKAGYLVIDVTDNSKTKDITNLVKSLPEYVSWTDQIPDYIFAFQKDYVNMIDATKKGIYPEYLKGIKGFGLFGTSIYVLNEDYTTAKLAYDKPETKETLEDEALEEKIFSKLKSDYFRLDILTNEIIAFLGNKQDLILNLSPYSIPDEKIIGTSFFPDDSNLLIWTKQKVGIVDIAAEENTGQQIFKYSWIYKSGTDIKQCFFVYNGSHALFLDEDKVYMLSLRQYGKHAVHEIVTVKEDSHIFYSEFKGELYFIDSNTGYLCAITILPK